MHRVHAPLAAPPSVELTRAEAHHVTQVLRLGVGAEVAVFDGRGREWLGHIVSLTRASVVVDLISVRDPVVEPPVHVTIAVAVLKGGHMDAVVRDATMLGVAEVAPFVSARAVVPARGRQASATDRWERIAVASAKQCGRAVVPAIRPTTEYRELLRASDAALRVLCVEPGLAGGAADGNLPRPDRALVLVGPEGGWSADELEDALRAGARRLDLGPRTLRADVAPTVALSALWTRWGWR